MIFEDIFQDELKRVIREGIREDVGLADHSSLACIPSGASGMGRLLVKDTGIIAGVTFAKQIFQEIDHAVEFEEGISDGASVTPGDIVFIVRGNVHSILKAERLVLNAMQRMSAIATKTNKLVKTIEGTGTKLLDTRKTSPGLRCIEKWAVRIGGGYNHRFGLYDMIMLKDNHIDFSGGVSKAIENTRRYVTDHNLDLKIIVEARNLDEVREILRFKDIYRILLDNFNYQDTRAAVKLIGHHTETEVSGNINASTIRQYADCGVDYISCGTITHSVNALDLSLKAFF